MKSVLVGNIDGDRLYYVIDSTSSFDDGVIASSGKKPTVVNFWETVKSAESFIPITGTKFHDFLWSYGDAANKEYWHSCFVSKRLHVSDEMLNGAVIRKDVLNRSAHMRDIDNRAIDFKNMLLARGEKTAPRGLGSRIGARLDNLKERATGRIRGFRADAEFDPNAVDADMDGFVQEGTQFARPSIPGVNTPNASMPKTNAVEDKPKRNITSALKSKLPKFIWHRPGGADGDKTRWIDRSARVIQNEFDIQEKTLRDKYNDGKEIKTVADAKKIIATLAPRAKVDFIESANDDNDLLTPFQQSIFLGAMYGIHVAPQLHDRRITISAQDPNKGEQGSQRLVTPFFIAGNNKFFQVSRRPGRQTKESGHIIKYAPENAKSSRIRPGRFHNGNWQRGSFENLSYDISGMKVAAAYLFDEEDDPDYKRFREVAKRIEELRDADSVDISETELLEHEHKLLQEIFSTQLENIQRTSPESLDERIELAKNAMMRAVLIHELGHAAQQEASYRDALKAADEAANAHIKKYRRLGQIQQELGDAMSSGDMEKAQKLADEGKKLLDEAQRFKEVTNPKYLDELENATDVERLPFYLWHIMHGEGSEARARKIAETIQDQNASRAVSELMMSLHGTVMATPYGLDIVPVSWFEQFFEPRRRDIQTQIQDALSRGDTQTARDLVDLGNDLVSVMNDVAQKSASRMNEEVFDKSGKPVKITKEMHETLTNLRQQSIGSAEYTKQVADQIGENGEIGDNLRLRDVLDFIALGSLRINRRLKGHFDPELGPNISPHTFDDSANPQDSMAQILPYHRLLQTNFRSISDIADPETRSKMSEIIRRIGLVNEIGHPLPYASNYDMNTRLNTVVDSVSISDTFAGQEVPNPLDASPSASHELIDVALKQTLIGLMERFGGSTDNQTASEQAAQLIMHSAVARHMYDDLTKEEREIAEHISKYGGGTSLAAYLSLIPHVPVAGWLHDEWGENRVELFSELAAINQLRMTMYSADRGEDGQIISRLLNEREKQVLKKLLSWYQPGVEFQIGSTPPPKDRK